MNKIDNIYFSATIKLFEKNYFSRGEEKKKKEKKNKAENTYIVSFVLEKIDFLDT